LLALRLRLWLLLSAEAWYRQLINGSSGENGSPAEAELATAEAGTSFPVRPGGRPAA